ncbi:pilus assembly protein PilP [Trichlorobacter lovleyi]|uniref:pilus assembly protein PilP n=1 Tax=Trichlorobacter lovleyi TaxID=313985 RepID=UPI00223EB7E6|nr:pilus assembly protein PilP [Trichlorobacter lovleyi]QOX78680.1 pilus assembly protein PilP [Trichlorobacter lovleyi]
MILLAGLMIQAGCKKTQSPPPPPAPAAPAAAAAQTKPLVLKAVSSSVKMAPVQTNQLDFSTKKDPFKPHIAVKAATSAELSRQKRELRPLLPLHSFDVSQFRLIGTVTDSKGNKAMVVDPAGKGYVLKVGMTIGKNEGKITRIESSGVDVVEQFHDENNKIRKETIRIPLLRKP